MNGFCRRNPIFRKVHDELPPCYPPCQRHWTHVWNMRNNGLQVILSNLHDFIICHVPTPLVRSWLRRNNFRLIGYELCYNHMARGCSNGQKIGAIFDFREIQIDYNQKTELALERIEAKVEVLQLETSNLRRIKSNLARGSRPPVSILKKQYTLKGLHSEVLFNIPLTKYIAFTLHRDGTILRKPT